MSLEVGSALSPSPPSPNEANLEHFFHLAAFSPTLVEVITLQGLNFRDSPGQSGNRSFILPVLSAVSPSLVAQAPRSVSPGGWEGGWAGV